MVPSESGLSDGIRHQFVLWLVPTVEKFPRSQKFLLGDRIQTTALDVLEGLIEATNTRHRVWLLGRVNVGIENLGFLFHLAAELRHLDMRRYEFAARSLDEIGHDSVQNSLHFTQMFRRAVRPSRSLMHRHEFGSFAIFAR